MDFTIQINTIWVLFGAVLVFMMQAGFAMLEAGFIRKKNAGNIVMKNLLDFVCGSLAFYIIGYGLMFGVAKGGFFGALDLFSRGQYDTGGISSAAHIIYNTMFCATAATIASGAVAERVKFKAYLIMTVCISVLVYPITASWVWGGGWLSTLTIGDAAGFVDHAGSTLVHIVGGTSAFIGAKVVGARLDKFDKHNNPKGIQGHSAILSALGLFLLWLGWFGFNGTAGMDITSPESAEIVSGIFLNTNLSAAASALSAMVLVWIRYGKPDISMTINGALAGLVAITAGCASVDPWAAIVIGAAAGVIMVFAVEIIEKVLKVDDPVGASAVHAVCGLFGTLAVGLFSRENGLFLSGSANQLLIQLIGALSVMAWTAVIVTAALLILKHTMGIRVSAKEEIDGLDISEHGMRTIFSDLTLTDFDGTGQLPEEPAVDIGEITPEMAIPVKIAPELQQKIDNAKLTKVVILTKQSKFEALKNALNDIGVTGMTVSQVLGCGMQKGNLEYYRGSPVDSVQLLPKIQVDIVIAKVSVDDVVKAAKKVLYTGHIGDGKIFVYDVKNAIKIRTGEEGYCAMQGVDE